MQTALSAWTNHNLFSNHYIKNRLENTDEWKDLDEEEVEEAFETISSMYNSEMPQLATRNEMPLEDKFIRPVFSALDHYWEVQQSVQRNRRTPDYAFFSSDEAREKAFERKQRGGDVYKNAIGIADAKAWNRNLDVENNDQRDFGNPNYQISYYLQETPPEWGILTNGRKWRLYYGPTSHKLTSYFEVDLPTIIESEDVESFKRFYILFRRKAFLLDSQGECFLDRVYRQSARFSRELGEDIQDRIYEALKVLAEGFLEDKQNNLDKSDINIIHDASLVYLYRLIFVLYAESESRTLLPVNSQKYSSDYSLNEKKVEICEELEEDDPKYRDYEWKIWDDLEKLFRLIDKGSKEFDIPEDDFYIPAYNGGLFRTDPSEYDRPEPRFLQNNKVSDEYLAEVIRLISETGVQEEGEHKYADYSSLSVRHLGSIYEGLLEYDLDVADEALVAIEDGDNERWISQSDHDESVDDKPTRDPGDVYLKTTRREESVYRSYKPAGNKRQEFGSYYTPEYVVQYIVEDSLDPVLEEIKEEVQEEFPGDEYAESFTKKVFDLSILDPAMGSGHFLTGVVDYLASEILEAREQQVDDEGAESISGEVDSEWVRRRVAQRCIYGIDVQPMAVELAKVSLWLNTLAAERPLAFLDHHLKHGNSLIGSDLEEIEELPINIDDDDQTSWGAWGTSHQEALERVIELSQDLLDIEMEGRADVKKMEEKYQEIQEDDHYLRVLSICDIHTANELGVDISSGEIENMARGIKDDQKWAEIEEKDSYQAAEDLRSRHSFFHWHLEFPQVFYGGDENDIGSPGGFDVVLGNPPYGGVDDEVESYLEQKYTETAEYFIDSFALFVQKGLSLLREDGQFGYIIPQQWLTQPNAEELRKYILTNSWIRTIIRFEERVFEGVDVDTIIMMAEKTDGRGPIRAFMADNSNEELPELQKVRDLDQNKVLDLDDYRIEIRGTPEEQQVLSKIRNSSIELEPQVGEVRIGIQVYNKSKHDEDTRKNRAFHSDEKETDDHLLELKGRHVERYYINPSGAEYLKFGDHLHDPIPRRFCTGPRILIQEITNESRRMINASYTDEENCFDKSVLGVKSTSKYDTHFILGVICSEAISWMFPRVSNKIISSFVTGSFPRIMVDDARGLPIPKIDFQNDSSDRDAIYSDIKSSYTEALDGGGSTLAKKELTGSARAGHETAVHDAVSEFAENLGEWYEEKNKLNTDLLSYIEPFDTAGTLEEVAQPISGLEDTVLTEKGFEPQYEIEGFEIVEEPNRVTISVTVESDDDSEDPGDIPVYRFWDLSESEIRLLKEYLPVVLEKSKEKTYAGFLPHTTSRDSLMDRLRSLQIPELSDIESSFEQYVEVADKQAQLEDKIETTENLANEAIYSLYGLNQEQRDIVEEGLQKQED